VWVEIVCADERVISVSLDGCDFGKAEKFLLCDPEHQRNQPKTPNRDCDAFTNPRKVANCKLKQAAKFPHLAGRRRF
jgi:hypothetical protein